MTERPADYSVFRRALDGIMAGSVPAQKNDQAQPLAASIVFNGPVFIGDGTVVTCDQLQGCPKVAG